jgi:hypothetical protein
METMFPTTHRSSLPYFWLQSDSMKVRVIGTVTMSEGCKVGHRLSIDTSTLKQSKNADQDWS